jgi:hypothetical protein
LLSIVLSLSSIVPRINKQKDADQRPSKRG